MKYIFFEKSDVEKCNKFVYNSQNYGTMSSGGGGGERKNIHWKIILKHWIKKINLSVIIIILMSVSLPQTFLIKNLVMPASMLHRLMSVTCDEEIS